MLNKLMRFLNNEVLDIFSPLTFLIAGFIMTVKFSASINELSTGNGAFLGLGVSCIAICFMLFIKLAKYILRRLFKVVDFSFMNVLVPFVVLLVALFNSAKMALLFEDKFFLLLIISLVPVMFTTIDLMKKRSYRALFVVCFYMIITKYIYTLIIMFRMPSFILYFRMNAFGILLEMLSDFQFILLIIALIFAKSYKLGLLKVGTFFAGAMAIVGSVLFIKDYYFTIISGGLDVKQIGMMLLEPFSSFLVAVVMIYLFFYIYVGEKIYFKKLKYLIMVPSVIWVLQSVYNSTNNIQFIMPKVVITFVVSAGLYVLVNTKKDFFGIKVSKETHDLKMPENTKG